MKARYISFDWRYLEISFIINIVYCSPFFLLLKNIDMLTVFHRWTSFSNFHIITKEKSIHQFSLHSYKNKNETFKVFRISNTKKVQKSSSFFETSIIKIKIKTKKRRHTLWRKTIFVEKQPIFIQFEETHTWGKSHYTNKKVVSVHSFNTFLSP